eukprot:scaffold87510_cov47-Attheya_sp.AAC.2
MSLLPHNHPPSHQGNHSISHTSTAIPSHAITHTSTDAPINPVTHNQGTYQKHKSTTDSTAKGYPLPNQCCPTQSNSHNISRSQDTSMTGSLLDTTAAASSSPNTQ